jgi:hypothetical protein
MKSETIPVAVEHFVKKVSHSLHREVERFVRSAVESGQLQGDETFTATVTVTSDKVGLMATIYSKIEL